MAYGSQRVAFCAACIDTYGKNVAKREIDGLAMETLAWKRFGYVARYATKKFRVLFANLAKTNWMNR